MHPLSGLLSAYGMGLAPQRASRERSIEAPLDDATMRESGKSRLRARQRGDRGAARPGRRARRHRHRELRASALRRHRHGASRAAVGARLHAPRLRGAAPPALRLHLAGEGHRRRRHRGRRGGERRRSAETGADSVVATRPCAACGQPPARDAVLFARGVARGAGRAARGAGAGHRARRPGAGHRAAPDHRRRARLEARAHRAQRHRHDARRPARRASA